VLPSRCLLRNFGGAIVADVRRERRNEHQGALEEVLDARRIRLYARAQCSSNERQPSASRRALCMNAWMISGL